MAYRIWSGPLYPVGEGATALARRERETLAALAESFSVSAPGLVAVDRVVDNVDCFLAKGRSQRAWRVRALLRLVEYLPVFSTGRPLTSMCADARRRLLRRKFQAARGLWWIAAKSRYLVLLGIYGEPSVARETGFVPPQDRDRYRRTALGRLGEGLEPKVENEG